MKKLALSFALAFTAMIAASAQTKLITRTGQANIFSHTIAEDISATNNTVTGLINTSSGEVAISVPVQSFQFEKALMQEHFNSDHFMDSKQFPRILLKGKIINFSAIDFTKDGKYDVDVAGDLTIKGVAKPITAKATLEVINGKIIVSSKFTVHEISSYGVGKPMGKKKNNVAEDIDVSYSGIYEKGNE